MRMDARKRGFLHRVLRSKGCLGLLLLALPVGLSQVDIAGRSVGSHVGQLVFPPADARRAARGHRFFDTDFRHPSAPVQLPAFAPSGRVPAAFVPSPQTPVFGQPATTPAFGAVPHARPSAPGDARKPPGFLPTVNK